MGNCTKIKNKQLKDFVSLPREAQERLISTSESIKLPKGSLIFEESQPLDKLFCIKK
nr:hypothetical protein [uncultured Allomuricauda sp.]